ncbi:MULTISPECIES: DUF4118 domain-containing protein [Giesbergeria]|uniref:histidine kinase n=1 Tax=Giesbergeria sinuosa TaxID=80883 RepID=A0ABV9QDR3_9BURK
MEEQRPDPDALLARMLQEEGQAHRGRLKIFFGANAGVGKTYAMLAAAHAAKAEGVPVIIGVVETHGRLDTEVMAEHLPRLPLRQVLYRDRVLPEFDLDAALAFGVGQPQALVLLDELAHSNVAGSRHPKRWQDAEELLDAGIDVWSTMNVQHLESLNDIVSGITGIRVWETVPDRLFDAADEVVVVDLPPDELLQRLKAGKVYLSKQAEQAAANFFRKGNLLALRELALRRTADRVDDEMRAYRRASLVKPVWPNREALLACVGSGLEDEKVVRTCARMAAQLDVPWHALHVEPLGQNQSLDREHEQALRVLKLAQELGATVATVSHTNTAVALVRYAREQNLVRLVLGRRSHRRWPWQRPLVDALIQQADDLDVLQVALPQGAVRTPPSEQKLRALEAAPIAWSDYAAAAMACVMVALLISPLSNVLELSNIVMLFLLAVVGVGLRFGRGPAVLAAFLGVLLFDFFFVAPRFSFAVSDVQYLVTFAVMLVVALVIGQLTAGLKVQAEAATQREHRVRSLYEMSRDLSAALLSEQVAEIGARFLASEFQARSTLLAADEQDHLEALPGGNATVDMGVAQWAFDRAEAAGLGTDTLPSTGCLVLPLKAPMRVRGVLALELGDPRLLGPEQRRLLDTCASLLAISLERIHYIEMAQKSTVQIESERLRNSLLSAISHDLRTPLASLVGLSEALLMMLPAVERAQHEIVDSIKNSALRMSALVNNLLDMARLQGGTVHLHRAWQPLDEVIGCALTACAAMMARRPIQIHLAEDLPLLHLDSVLMERVWVNLLENIAKYTPEGSPVTINAKLKSGEVVIDIDDSGPGLPPGKEELLFDKFERGQRETTTPGVGLGLAICRAIVEAHGGHIAAHNRHENSRVVGARFVMVLPCGNPPQDDGTGIKI